MSTGKFAVGVAIVAGAVMGAWCVLAWAPLAADALTGTQPKGWWLLSRASGLAAYGALWLSMALGLTISNRLSRVWPGGPMAVDVHRHASLLSLALTLVHAVVLLGDRYIDFSLAAILLPFSAPTEKWLAIAAGQLAFYLLALVIASFYVRNVIGPHLWRGIHFSSFALFALATVHGLAAGSDSWAAGMYWVAVGTIVFLAVQRVLRRAFAVV